MPSTMPPRVTRTAALSAASARNTSPASASPPDASPAHQQPGKYLVTRSERYVFNTPPYSARIKTMWRFKNERDARKSAEEIYACFEEYRDATDFVGMDVCRKFLQMGRTRSMRYALRPGGKKYIKTDDGGRREMERSGKVYDQEKLDGAQVFKQFERRCWKDETYIRLWKEFGGTEIRSDDS